MKQGVMTAKEHEILETLLASREVTEYVIVNESNEGKSLPGSSYPCEVESISGLVVTKDKVFVFWLDWYEDHYTLGDEEGFWRELPPENFQKSQKDIEEARERLKRRRLKEEERKNR